MSIDKKAVSVSILDKDYQFACSSEEKNSLIASARFLDDKMREVRSTGRTVGADRIAVMAALNIAHDLLNNGGGGEEATESLSLRVKDLRESVETVLETAK